MAPANKAVAASLPVAEAAAMAVLQRGNAVDAVVAGVFAAAAATPTVLLGPVQLLVGGPSMGLRAFDGRSIQPGLGLPRPRGFLAEEPIPDAARVAVPALPATLAIALAAAGTASLARAVGPAVEEAKARSAERADVLKRIGQRGAQALTDARLADELVAAAGRIAGGVLTAEDLSSVRPSVLAAARAPEGAGHVVTVPWRALGRSGGNTEIVAVADGRGVLAIACYEAPLEGLPIPELGLTAPLHAEPVRRGERRVRPGEPREVAAPIALRELAGAVDVALGVGRADEADTWLQAASEALGRDETLDAATGPREGRGSATVLAVTTSRAGAYALVRRHGSA